jgi:hypothetical protein
MHKVTPGRSARILQPRRALRPLIVLCGLCVACGVSSCAAPAGSSGGSSAGSQGSDSTAPSPSAAVPRVSAGASVPQEPDSTESPSVDGRERAPRTSFDSSRPVRAAGGTEDTVVVSAPGPHAVAPSPPSAVAPSTPSTATAVEAPVTSAPPSGGQPLEAPAASPAAQQTSPSARPEYNGPVSGKLTCNGTPIIQNGEVVFGGLPPGRLQVTYDTAAWDLRIRPDERNTQKVVLRNKRPGVQRNCTVTWQLVE